MNRKVLDTSAILAVLLVETGNEIVEPMLEGSLVSCVNVAEVFSKLIERGLLTRTTSSDFQQLGVEIVEHDFEQAMKAAELRPLTRHLGLSLGDRSCLALAMLRDATAVTADRDWKKLSFCQVETIR